MPLITTVTDLQQSGTKEFTYRDRPAILVASERGIRAYYNICTHEGGTCELIGRDLQCCVHGARFNPATGKALSIPAPLDSKLTPIPIRIEGDAVYVD